MGKFEPIHALLADSKKPLIIAGYGIRSAWCVAALRHYIESTGIPFVTTWGGADLIETGHPLNLGIIGVSGQRGANKACFAADFILALGTHLSPTQTGQAWAPQAKKAIIDIDQDQLDNLTIEVDVKVCADLNAFLGIDDPRDAISCGAWWQECAGYKALNEQMRTADRRLTSYQFNELMTSMLPAGTVMVVDGGGTTLYTGFQSSVVKLDSRLICSMAISAMGSGLPEAIGACFANWKKLTTCLIGDGSLMLNVQELQTIKHHDLPIKIFVINNGGYLAIRHTQKAFLEGRFHGTSEKDCSLPRVERLATAFCIPYCAVESESSANASLPLALAAAGPAIVEVYCPHDQDMCRQEDGKSLNTMHPVLA